jgi:uncharacterized membrane protein
MFEAVTTRADPRMSPQRDNEHLDREEPPAGKIQRTYSMSNVNDILHSVDVNAPVRVAYNQWTQFEMFPRFMDGVDSITQIGDDRLIWKVSIAGVSREFDTTITEQTPDQRIAWTTTEGPKHAGVVTFHKIDDDTTRVTLQMDYDPEGVLETIADKVGFVSKRIEGDLENFKAFIEDRDVASGAWRGVITNT